MKKYMLFMFGFWLGFSISMFTGYGLSTWQWWAIFLPTAIIFVFDENS